MYTWRPEASDDCAAAEGRSGWLVIIRELEWDAWIELEDRSGLLGFPGVGDEGDGANRADE